MLTILPADRGVGADATAGRHRHLGCYPDGMACESARARPGAGFRAPGRRRRDDRCRDAHSGGCNQRAQDRGREGFQRPRRADADLHVRRVAGVRRWCAGLVTFTQIISTRSIDSVPESTPKYVAPPVLQDTLIAVYEQDASFNTNKLICFGKRSPWANISAHNILMWLCKHAHFP